MVRLLIKDNYEMKWWTIYLLFVITYCISHGLMLTLYGAWWDDMLLWNVSQNDLEKFIGPDNFNNPMIYYTIKSIAKINDMKAMTVVFRFVPFLCWFISLSSFFLLIKNLTNSKVYAFYTSLLAASCGINKCMVLISCFHYSISIALFMMGLVTYAYYFKRGKNVFQFLTAVLWLLSLIVWRSAVLVIPSMIVYAGILKVNFQYNNRESYKRLIVYVFCKNWMIIVGLFTFVVLYKTILAPSGVYEDYYAIDWKNVLLSPIMLITSTLSFFLGYLSSVLYIYANAGNKIIFIAPLILLIYFMVIHLRYENMGNKKGLITIAVIFLLFSIFPHVLRATAFSFALGGYVSRVVSLAIFPLMMIVGGIIVEVPNKIGKIIFSILFISSLVYSLNVYFDYNRGWARNEALSRIFIDNKFLDGKKIKVINRAIELRTFMTENDAYYEYEGCARLAYGKNTATRCSSCYEDFLDSIPDYDLIIETKEPISLNGAFSYFKYNIDLYLYRIINRDKYEVMISNMLQYRIVPHKEVGSS